MTRHLRLLTACRMIGLVAAIHGFALTANIHAQPPGPIAEARRIRDSGDMATAASLLRAHLKAHPDDGEAARLLGETLYWLHDVPAARDVYEAAIRRHPQDTTVRLQYARMLAETRDRNRARSLLLPLRQIPIVQADATALLGTIAYWQGDLTSARRLFEETLRARPGHADAARQLREILAVTRPWLRIGPGRREDDQPLERKGIDMEAGWFLTPLGPVTARLDVRDYDAGGSPRRFWNGELSMTRFLPSLRVDTELRGGVHRRPDDGSPDSWYGAVGAGVRVPGHVKVRARVERTPYLYTIASLDAPILPRAVSGIVEWQHPRGWSAEVAHRQQWYDDGNRVTSAYGWMLAPIVFRSRMQLQAGYAFSREHSDENRFVLARPVQSVPIGNPGFDTSGRYQPYYTPNHLEKHSAVISAVLTARNGFSLRANTSIGIRATDEHPVLYVSGTEVLRTFYPRTFRPRDLTVSLDVPVGRSAVLSVTGDTGRSAFYSWSSLGLHLTYHFRTPPSSPTP